MTPDFAYYLNQFVAYYKESYIRRFFIGGILGGLLWGASFVLSLIIRQLLNTDTFLETLLNDIPGIGLILGLLITLEIWGLIPNPVLSSDKDLALQNNLDNSEMKNELDNNS
ncbi:MAG: hypothetical protein ACFE9L_05975 [Candidatus Hodarchaeota archaeon]